MRPRYLLIAGVLLLAGGAVVALSALPALAQPGASPSEPVQLPAESLPPPSGILMALPVVALEPAEVPAGMDREQAARFARQLTQQQAEPFLDDLEQLRSIGAIAGFELRPDLHGIAVVGAEAEAAQQLGRLPGVAAVLPLSAPATAAVGSTAGGALPACALAAAEALPQQVLALSQMRALPPSATGGVVATDPSIYARVQPGDPYTPIGGYTTPATTVYLRILRGGQVAYATLTTSAGDGSYSFRPYYYSCPTPGYNWTLHPGDVLEVTAHDSAVTLDVVAVSAWIDPVADTVSGVTAAGRPVGAQLAAPAPDACSNLYYTQAGASDADGAYAIDFSAQVDVNGGASTSVQVHDASGNYLYLSAYAFRISAYFDDTDVWGYLKPEVDFTATLRRGDQTASVLSGQTAPDGSYSGVFTQTIRAGDVLLVSGGGVTLQTVAAGLQVTVDAAGNQATGVTAPGRRVKATFYRADSSSNVRTGCSSSGLCASTFADADGSFALSPAMDLLRGDYAAITVYDAAGNYQALAGSRHASALILIPAAAQLRGYWSSPSAALTGTVRDSGGDVIETQTGIGLSSDGAFSWYLDRAPSLGETIAVGDGTLTETMTVQEFTGRLSGSTGHLTGTAPDGALLAWLSDTRRSAYSTYSYCKQTTVAGGVYDLTFEAAEVTAQDYAYVWSTGPEGHYTRLQLYAFTINAEKGGVRVYGYTETPGVPVSVTLRRDGVPVDVYTTTASTPAYSAYLLDAGSIGQGDAIQVQTGDGNDVTVTVPELTIATDPVENRLYGRAPAGDPLAAMLWRVYNGGSWGYGFARYADAYGDWSVSLSSMVWSRDCSLVAAGHRCVAPELRYYDVANHGYFVLGTVPPVPPDSYESDGASADATPYTGIQTHSLHFATDADWVAFTVPQEDIDAGALVHIRTLHLGWGMGTRVRLYNATPVLQALWLGYESNGRGGVDAFWKPTLAGTYYLEITPPSSSYAGYCDAFYDLEISIVRSQVHIPVAIRNRW